MHIVWLFNVNLCVFLNEFFYFLFFCSAHVGSHVKSSFMVSFFIIFYG